MVFTVVKPSMHVFTVAGYTYGIYSSQAIYAWFTVAGLYIWYLQ